jgi:hypothetical protein
VGQQHINKEMCTVSVMFLVFCSIPICVWDSGSVRQNILHLMLYISVEDAKHVHTDRCPYRQMSILYPGIEINSAMSRQACILKVSILDPNHQSSQQYFITVISFYNRMQK